MTDNEKINQMLYSGDQATCDLGWELLKSQNNWSDSDCYKYMVNNKIFYSYYSCRPSLGNFKSVRIYAHRKLQDLLNYDVLLIPLLNEKDLTHNIKADIYYDYKICHDGQLIECTLFIWEVNHPDKSYGLALLNNDTTGVLDALDRYLNKKYC